MHKDENNIKVRKLAYGKNKVYKPLTDNVNEGIYIPDVTVKGVKISEIPEYNIFKYDKEEEECEIMFFPFNSDFLDKVLEMHRKVGEYIDIKYHLSYILGDNCVTHARQYNNKIVILYTDQDELNNMFKALLRNLTKTTLKTRTGYCVKISIDMLDWNMLYTSSMKMFSRIEEYNSNIRM